jgi:predicted RNase H-like HicB family nuclease
MSAKYDFTVLFEPTEEGGYTAIVPALPGEETEGRSLEDARAMAIEAIQCHIESLLKDGEPIPHDVKIELDPVKERVSVFLGAA